MRFRFFSILFLILLIFPLLLSIPQGLAKGEEKYYIVSAEILHLREGPGLTYPIIDTLQNGELLTFIDKRGDWLEVEVNGTKGWVASWLTTEQSSQTNSLAISQVDRLNIRLEPSLSSPVLGQLNKGDQVQIIGKQDKWLQIQYQQLTGWVHSDYLSISETPKERVEEVEIENTQKETAKHQTASNLFTVSVDAVNVRTRPDLNSTKLGIAYKGEQFEVKAREQNWVKIEFKGKEGWMYSFYGSFDSNTKVNNHSENDQMITIIYNGTNLREKPSTSSKVLYTVMAGKQYKILETEGDWYKIEVSPNEEAYVASWVVSYNKSQTKQISKRKKGTLNGVTIVLDPGHGGNDQGTSGLRGTIEKDVTLKTVELLKSKLQQAGAEVYLTRESDVYVGLRKRVSIAHQFSADAFISIHYDATEDRTVSGFTTYYFNSYQQSLAKYVHSGLANHVSLRDRGVQRGNYLVLRENRQSATLVELGYLSNPSEEQIVTTDYFREQATMGIYEGILKYFDAQLGV